MIRSSSLMVIVPKVGLMLTRTTCPARSLWSSTRGLFEHVRCSSREDTRSRRCHNEGGLRSVSRSAEEELLDKKLLQPFKYIERLKVAKYFDVFLNAIDYWLKIPSEKVTAIGYISQTLCSALLLIDDFQDNSVLRAGLPVAHSIYGIANAVNAANFVQNLNLKKVLDLGHPDAINVYIEQLNNTHRGQGLDILWRDTFICPTEEEYRSMVLRKIGGIHMLIVGLMQLFSDNEIDLKKLIDLLALYYQIRDDYCNLCLKEFHDEKSFCDDLTEGKFGFPVIHAIRTHPEDHQILHILQQRTRDNVMKRYCVSLLEEFGSLDYTRRVLHELDAEIREEVKRLGGNPDLEDILDSLLNWAD